MRTVNMTVVFTVVVPDGTDDDLAIEIPDYSAVTVGYAFRRELLEGGQVIKHETIDVEACEA